MHMILLSPGQFSCILNYFTECFPLNLKKNNCRAKITGRQGELLCGNNKFIDIKGLVVLIFIFSRHDSLQKKPNELKNAGKVDCKIYIAEFFNLTILLFSSFISII